MSTITFTRSELLAGRARKRLIEDNNFTRGFRAGGDEELLELVRIKNEARRKALTKKLIAEVEAELEELGIKIEDDA